MKSTKEKIGLIMLATMGIFGFIGMIIRAYMKDFWTGSITIVVLLYIVIMIKCFFNE